MSKVPDKYFDNDLTHFLIVWVKLHSKYNGVTAEWISDEKYYVLFKFQIRKIKVKCVFNKNVKIVLKWLHLVEFKVYFYCTSNVCVSVN